MSLASEARVRVFDRDGSTLRATFTAKGLSWSHGKGVDGADVSFAISETESGFTSTIVDDGIGVVQLDLGSGWVNVGTPYLLKADGDVVVDGKRTLSVTGRGVLGVASEWPVVHDAIGAYITATGGDLLNRRGPTEVYYGWMHPEFDPVGWHDPDRVATGDLTISDAKYGHPASNGGRFSGQDYDWVYRSTIHADAGRLTLMRLGSFTVTGSDNRKVSIAMSADEEFKAYLFGPGQGGLIMEESEQEDGFMIYQEWTEVLVPGTYFLAAEMTTVNTPSGDGFDALAFLVGYPDNTDNTMGTVLRSSADSGIKVWRQSLNAVRPGFTVGRLVRLLHDEAKTWYGSGSSAHAITLGFSDTLDTASVAWDNVGQRSWTVGTSVAQVMSDLADIADFDVSPGMVLQAWGDKGQNLSATVGLKPGSPDQDPGENIVSYGFTSTPLTMTRAIVHTEDGYGWYVNTSKEASAQKRCGLVESEQSSSIGSAVGLAARVVNVEGAARDEFTGAFIGVTGAVPGVDFTWGDTVAALNRAGSAANRRVVSYAASRDDDGPITFTGELS